MAKTLRLNHGTLAFDDSGGSGFAIVLAPSIGDVRGEYRFLAPILIQNGWRVLTMDMRGQGESSVHWPEYTPEAVGSDYLALIEANQTGPTVLVGCSLSAAAAIWAAAENPQAVAGVVLIGPFARDLPTTALQSAFLRIGFSGPWRIRAWDMFYGSLYKSAPPADLAAYRKQLRANLGEPGRFDAVVAYIRASKSAAEARIASVTQPALVVMGSQDPDFPDPAAEAKWLAGQISGEVVIVEGAGHYPQVEQPGAVAAAIQKWAIAHNLATA